MKTNYAVEVQEMSMQEMREVNGGCCLIKWLIKLCCWKPKPCKPGKPTPTPDPDPEG